MDQQVDIRARIVQLEEQLMEERTELERLRAQLPPDVVADFELESLQGPVKLSQAFGDQQDLIVIHSMGAGCNYCTLWADGFNGVIGHLTDRTAFVVVSPDTPAAQQAFAQSRQWKFRMLSDASAKFTRAMGFLRQESADEHYWPGVSAFWRAANGEIQRTGSSQIGPGDEYCAVWHLFGLLKKGVDGWEPKRQYSQQR